MEKGSNPSPSNDNWVAVGEIRSDVKHLIGHSKTQSEDLKELRAEIKADMRSFNEDIKELANRVSSVENKQWRWAGTISAIAFIIPLLITVGSMIL